MTDLLTLGAGGVRGYSRALQTIGDNIANAQTPGFARRSTTLSEQVASGDTVFYRNQVTPGGVQATGVTRATDPWLIEDARTSAADAGRTAARLTWLEASESALNDGGAGVGRAMTRLFNRADELAADPAGAAQRTAFLQSADDLAATFRRTADSLAGAADGVADAAGLAVGQVNTDVSALSRVNVGLRRARDGSSNQATLLDERDRLIDAITATLPVTVALDARGAADLTLPGGALLFGKDQTMLALSTLTGGRLALSAGGHSLSPATGALAGLIDAADHIAGQRSALDAVAMSIAAAVNTQHQAGRDAAGNAGLALLTIASGAADIVAAPRAIGEVAAADGAGANGNALAFGTLRGANGGEAIWATLAAQQSQQVASARAQDAAASSRRDGAATARDAISAVDLDREAADLVRFQQAYDASARVIQVARETMQTILNAL